jgi:hypothetical protein
MTTKSMIRIITLSMGLLAAVPVAGFAQTARLDARWTPYLGCWRLYQDNRRTFDMPVSDALMVCVAPSTDNSGVALTTYADGRTILTQNIAADGLALPVNEADCQGTQTTEWSRDGERMFTTAELSCNGRPKRHISGVTVIVKGPTWVDVQATDVDGDTQVRIRRYRRAIERPAGVAELPGDMEPRAMADAQALSAVGMSLEDVIEASKKISAEALEAALDETGGRFNLNSRALRQLADAGVSRDVIDLMIAQSFPDRFKVDRAAWNPPPLPSSMSGGGTSTGYSGIAPTYPYYDPYYSYYSYYSPFAYPYWGSYYYNGYYPYYPPVVIVPPVGSIGIGGGGTIVGPPEPPGAVVNGRGYTRVSPGPPTATPSGDGSADSSRTVSSPRTVRSTGDPSGGSVSGSGYSSGTSSGGSTSGTSPSGGGSIGGDGGGGRTAQPR